MHENLRWLLILWYVAFFHSNRLSECAIGSATARNVKVSYKHSKLSKLSL